MDPLKKLKLLTATAEQKTQFIDDQLMKLEKLLDKLGILLNDQVIEDFLKELNVENGLITTDLQNQRKIALIEKAYSNFMMQQGYKVVTTMIEDLYGVTGLNQDYFSELQGMKINNDDISAIVNERLGLNAKGELKREGFMKGLLDDPTVKNEIKQFAMEKVTGGTGYEDLRKGLKEMVVGNDEKMGKFKQFYRNTAYDTYARIDALNGKLYADKLEMNYFIYAGTRRKASRHFCIHRKGQVFSREEALRWKDLIGTVTFDDKNKRVPAGPIVAGEDIATYNPFVDRGGYGCVDDIMWISDEVAFAKRPDLRKYSAEKFDNADEERIRLAKRNYVQHAEDGKTGAFIASHPEHAFPNKKGKAELNKNVHQSEYYFKRGKSVELLRAYDNHPSIDAKINGKLYEYEGVNKNKPSTIQRAIREAIHQFDRYNLSNKTNVENNVSLLLQTAVDAGNLIKGINYAIHHDYKINNLHLALPNGRLLEFTDADLKRGLYKSSIREALKGRSRK